MPEGQECVRMLAQHDPGRRGPKKGYSSMISPSVSTLSSLHSDWWPGSISPWSLPSLKLFWPQQQKVNQEKKTLYPTLSRHWSQRGKNLKKEKQTEPRMSVNSHTRKLGVNRKNILCWGRSYTWEVLESDWGLHLWWNPMAKSNWGERGLLVYTSTSSSIIEGSWAVTWRQELMQTSWGWGAAHWLVPRGWLSLFPYRT